MKCEEAMSRTAGRALGDLEAEEGRELELHLSSCAACRAVAEGADRTVAALRDSDAPSEARRERTVAAMISARDAAVGRIPRRRWIAMSAAAALLLAVGVSFLLSRGGLVVDRLDGTAWVLRRGAGARVALAVGDRIRSGDRIETEGVAALEAGRLKIRVHQGSRILYETSGALPRIRLEMGTVRVESPEEPVVLEGSGDASAVVRGTCEARFTAIGGHPGDPAKAFGFQIQVKKGGARFQGRNGAQELEEGQTLTVTSEGTVKVDGAPADAGRKP
jgi:hypothetical protein